MPRLSKLSWQRSVSLSSQAAASMSPSSMSYQDLHTTRTRTPTRSTPTSEPHPLWSQLPPDCIRRIWYLHKRHRAAMKIQAFWRGRDVRDWLSYPGAMVMNPTHPRYSPHCHLNACVDCRIRAIIDWRALQAVLRSPKVMYAWSYRAYYLEDMYVPGHLSKPGR